MTAVVEELDLRQESLTHTPEAAPWLIRAEDVRKKYCRDLRRSLWYGLRDVLSTLTLRPADQSVLREREFWAVDQVSFDLRRGDSLAILGRNGAGKSTLLKLVTGQRSLSSGTVTTRGRIVALTELGLGFDPVLTGRENAYINAAVHGISRRACDLLIEDIIDFAELREFIDSAVQTYSSGMKARLGFAVATHLDPDILIVDEVLAVGDLEFKRKCVQHILGYIKRGGSILLVAHEPYLIQSICNRCIVMDRGRIVYEGTGIEGVNFHFHMAHQKQMAIVAAYKEDAPQPSPAIASDAKSSAQASEPAFSQQLTEVDARARKFRKLDLSEAKPVVVDWIDVVPERGEVLRTGEPAEVIVRYRSLHRIEVLWGFTFCTSDLLVNIASCSKGMDGETSWLEAGEHALVCRVPSLPLQAGVYAVRGGIGDSVGQTAMAVRGYEDEPCFFSVTAAEVSRTSNFKMTRNDLVVMEAEWIS